MNRNELIKYKDKMNYNLYQLELDYMQHKILAKLYNKFNTIYFKGGTCLQKCYGIKRFSEDLDFNYFDVNIKEIIDYLEKELEIKATDMHSTKFGTSFTIKIKGILFNGSKQSICKIAFDFRENDIFKNPIKKIIRPIYHDLNNYFILALNTEEILAEKVRAILTRYKARDVFDLNELLTNNIKIDINLIQKKLESYKIKFELKEFTKKIKEKEKIYNNEMKNLVEIYPDFNECKKRIIKEFNLILF